MSKRESILQAVVAVLTAAAPSGVGVYRSRVDALQESEAPALMVAPETEVVQELGQGLVEARLQIAVTVLARAILAPDAAADPIIEAAHAALMADPTLGGLAFDTAEQSSEWAMDQTDLEAVALTARYVVWHRRSRASLTA